MAESFPFNHTGVFTIGKQGLPGGLTLKAVLSVPQNSSEVNGYGQLTQATHPPLNCKSAFHGSVHSLGVGSAKQVYAVQGTAVPPLLGAPHVTELVIQLDGIWGKSGKASYTYVVGSEFHRVEDQEVTVQWLLQEGERAA
ncbi:DUF1842 domain-containing protein [Trinickia terrae]|uniref:DUF1842 domain-containing protein n=1 Tax=Trinickia terrae TaxID=2571161 RepID=A0A4U1HJU7_9BURK|nr:DUF1842 domain-containing protein [Trinickia terrae]TKC81469.1 DUF1842 domain-containing protein [Trinickia terrae]